MCQNVATILMKLDKSIKKGIKGSFRAQLRSVRLVQTWHSKAEAWVWVVVTEEDKPKKPTAVRERKWKGKMLVKGWLAGQSVKDEYDWRDSWEDEDHLDGVA